MRWWDGHQWTSATQPAGGTPTPPSPPPAKRSRLGLWVAAGLVLVVIIIVAASISGGSDDGSSSAAASSTTTADAVGSGIGTAEVPTTAQETTTTTARAASCGVASDTYVSVINASFKEQGLSLSSPAYVVEAPGGLTYIGANVMRGDVKESSADVWVAKDVAVFSLSGSARELSFLPDGRRLLDASAGDEYGSAVQDCVIGRR